MGPFCKVLYHFRFSPNVHSVLLRRPYVNKCCYDGNLWQCMLLKSK